MRYLFLISLSFVSFSLLATSIASSVFPTLNKNVSKPLIDLDLDYDQCILEFGNATEYIDPTEPDWIHLSWKVVDNRRQTLVAYKDENNKTCYQPMEA